MKPFNLQDALAGKPVVTRDGRHVNQIAHFPKVELGVIVCIDEETETHSYTVSGKYFTYGRESDWDLFMDKTTKTVWCNVYPVDSSIQPYRLGAYSYDNEAKAWANRLNNAVATVSFEVEQ